MFQENEDFKINVKAESDDLSCLILLHQGNSSSSSIPISSPPAISQSISISTVTQPSVPIVSTSSSVPQSQMMALMVE
jgi:hypothetical protein